MRTLLGTAVAAMLLTVACKTEEPKPTPDVAPIRDAGLVDAGPPVAAPLPEIPPAPPLPTAPAELPAMTDSTDNPTTAEKVVLGSMLFVDKRLSKDDSMACLGCHVPEKAWTDGQPVATKVGGAVNKRNAPTMLNVGYHSLFYWDGRMPTLEAVSNAAWKGQLGADPKTVAVKLNALPVYRAYFQRAFKEDATADNVPKALAAFLRTLKSGGSAYDKLEGGDAKAASKDVQKGFEVFRKAGCALCHTPPLYSDFLFHNVGIGSDKAEADRDHGRKDATKDAQDEGKFKTPSLRDIALTGPYFHDGSVAKLDDAIDLMLGGGKKNPNLDEKLKAVKLKPKEKAQLKAFLESLTGTSYAFKAPELP